MAPLQVPGPILDVGGGGEGVIGLLREDVLAIDLHKEELEEAPFGPVKMVMDGRDLGFVDGAFQAATAFFTLMYMADRVDCRRVFGEIFRVLGPGGRLLVWDAAIPPQQATDKEIVALGLEIALRDVKISTGYGVLWPDEKRGRDYYMSLAREAGFTVREHWEREHLFFMELCRS
ncbi:MAG: methyltransferase domain-containing protein [Anaerolineae bacterium]